MTTHSTQEEQAKDNQLADFTDALLEGQTSLDAGRLQSREVAMVELLARAVAPQPVPDRLRQELTRRIAAEFSREHPPLMRRLLQSLGRPSHRRLWATAAIMTVVAIAAVLLFPLDGSHITGTVTGEIGGIALVFGLVLIGAMLIAWRVSRR